MLRHTYNVVSEVYRPPPRTHTQNHHWGGEGGGILLPRDQLDRKCDVSEFRNCERGKSVPAGFLDLLKHIRASSAPRATALYFISFAHGTLTLRLFLNRVIYVFISDPHTC